VSQLRAGLIELGGAELQYTMRLEPCQHISPDTPIDSWAKAASGYTSATGILQASGRNVTVLLSMGIADFMVTPIYPPVPSTILDAPP
jgi:hypothetical protein